MRLTSRMRTSVCRIMQYPTHLHNGNHLNEACMLALKRGKFTFFWQIRKFWQETSGGKTALVWAYLDGF